MSKLETLYFIDIVLNIALLLFFGTFIVTMIFA